MPSSKILLSLFGVVGALLVMFAIFLFGILVGQGEFDEEQEKIRGLLTGVKNRLEGLTHFTKKETMGSPNQTSDEIRYRFYQAKGAKTPEENKIYQVEIGDVQPSSHEAIKRLLEGSGLHVRLKGSEEGAKLIIGPFKTEAEAQGMKDQISSRLRLKGVKITQQGP